MRFDKFGSVIYQDSDIFHLMYQNLETHFPSLIVDTSSEITNLEDISGITFKKAVSDSRTIEEYDYKQQQNWFIPEKYQNFDIENWLYDQCKTDSERVRVYDELIEYQKHDLYNLLKWIKFFVDTARENRVLYGVGRGSSTASYVLFLLGLHKVDSIKYGLDYKEFLRD